MSACDNARALKKPFAIGLQSLAKRLLFQGVTILHDTTFGFNPNLSDVRFEDPKPKLPIRFLTAPSDVTEDYERLRNQKDTEEKYRNTTSLRQTGLSADADVVSHGSIEDDKPDPQREASQKRAAWFTAFRSKPFHVFIGEACTFNYHNAAHGDFTDGWTSDLFWFVYLVRGHDNMYPYLGNGKKAFDLVDQLIAGWKASAKKKGDTPFHGWDNDPWQSWFGVSRSSARAEFIDMWTKIRFMPGHDPLTQSVDSARRGRLGLLPSVRDKRPVADPPKRGEAWDESDYEFFVSVAGHLQVAMGDKDIKLPVERVGEIMKVTKMTISRYRGMAIEDGYLKVVKAHKYRPKGRGDATAFRFDVIRFPALRDKAQLGTDAVFRLIPEVRL
jgi:hypothetical protein